MKTKTQIIEYCYGQIAKCEKEINEADNSYQKGKSRGKKEALLNLIRNLD